MRSHVRFLHKVRLVRSPGGPRQLLESTGLEAWVNLAAGLARRSNNPVRVALIGAGKFGTMIMAQLRHDNGIKLCVLADLNTDRARESAERAGWPAGQFALASSEAAANDLARNGKVAIVDSGDVAAACDVDIVIEATGFADAAARHIWTAIEHGHHVINVTVEVDVVVGPLLYAQAQKRGVIYSLAYGDQPAIICELVDWARTNGFEVIAAGKGTKHLPEYKRSTPETALAFHEFTPEQIAKGGFNPKMFNSFLDGTKQSIEMVAVANATGLGIPADGLSYAPASVYELATVLRPRSMGGVLDRAGVVDVTTSHYAEGREVPNNIRYGMFVVFTSPEPYTIRCFSEYGLAVDPTGTIASMWRPYHLIGLEIGTSIASIAVRGEATGAPEAGFIGDVGCATRKALKAGSLIDGEGGYAVYGTIASAERSRGDKLVPMGLSQGCKLVRDVPADHWITEADVSFDESSFLWKLRRQQMSTLDTSVHA
jgi:predicted homoserine dehydrogenase-like protein